MARNFLQIDAEYNLSPFAFVADNVARISANRKDTPGKDPFLYVTAPTGTGKSTTQVLACLVGMIEDDGVRRSVIESLQSSGVQNMDIELMGTIRANVNRKDTTIYCVEPTIVTTEASAPRLISLIPFFTPANCTFITGRRSGHPARDKCKVIFVTPGIMLKILISYVTKRSSERGKEHMMIMFDEVHESSTDYDLCYYAIKRNMPRFSSIPVIFTSASFDISSLQRYFGMAGGVIKVKKEQAPVVEKYIEDIEKEIGRVSRDISPRYISAAVDIALNLCAQMPDEQSMYRDILIFMPGKAEVRKTATSILEGIARRREGEVVDVISVTSDEVLFNKEYLNKHLLIGFEGSLTSYDLLCSFVGKRFDRRVFVATTVIETGMTIPTLRYVIDTGIRRIGYYNPVADATSIVSIPISEDIRLQRRGRVSRFPDQKGVFYGIYSKNTELETYRKHGAFYENPSSLLARAIVIDTTETKHQENPPEEKKISWFYPSEFIVPIAPESVFIFLKQIARYSGDVLAFCQVFVDFELNVTQLCLLIEGIKRDCIMEMISVVSYLKNELPIVADRGVYRKSMAMLMAQSCEFSIIAYIFASYVLNETVDEKRWFCRKRGLNYGAMRNIEDIYLGILRRLLNFSEVTRNSVRDSIDDYEFSADKIRRCIRHVLRDNIAYKVSESGRYSLGWMDSSKKRPAMIAETINSPLTVLNMRNISDYLPEKLYFYALNIAANGAYTMRYISIA